MNNASQSQNSVSTRGPSNSSNPREQSLSFTLSRKETYALVRPGIIRAGGIAMLYPRNAAFFHSPDVRILLVIEPISFPVTPAVSSAAATSSASFVKAYTTTSLSITRKAKSLTPRFFARVAITAFSSSEREAESSKPSFASKPFFKISLVVTTREGNSFPVQAAFFSASIARTPSFEKVPKALPTSLFSMFNAFAISGRACGPLSFRKL